MDKRCVWDNESVRYVWGEEGGSESICPVSGEGMTCKT